MWRYVWNLRRVGMPASTSLATPTPFAPPPPPPACFPWPTLDVITTHVNQTKLPPDPQQSRHIDSKQLCGQILASVFSRTAAHILFVCAINLFLFFEHPVPFGWTSSLINFNTHPIQRWGQEEVFSAILFTRKVSMATVIKGQTDYSWFAT